MSLPIITAQDARRKLDEGAVLIDIREADEHARERIAGARHMPSSHLDGADALAPDGRPLLFHCRSGLRTRSLAGVLADKAIGCEAYLVEGGLDALKKAGVATLSDRRQPLELQRQVQIGAGALALGGTLLGLLASPAFFVVPGFVGAGLLVAGSTGFCGMARLLVHAPWNRALKA